MDSPDFMDRDLERRLQRRDAWAPNPPVVSKAKGEHNHPMVLHVGELAASLAFSAPFAVAVATSRVACGPDGRNGWTMVTSTAIGLESADCSKTSAGRRD